MFYLMHNDIEGLFRDAADNYQINTDKAFDWNKINKAVHQPHDQKTPGPPRQNTRRMVVIWILLLVCIGLFSYNIWYIEISKRTAMINPFPVQRSVPGRQRLAAEGKEPDAGKDISRKENKATENTSKGGHLRSTDIITGGDAASAFTGSTGPFNPPAINAERSNEGDGASRPAVLVRTAREGDIAAIERTATDPMAAPETGNRAAIRLPTLTIAASPRVDGGDAKKLRSKSALRFYAGMVVSPDVSFVKFQKTNGVGTTIGLTTGYRMSSRWSIETGLLWDSKKYYTKGEYFNKTNIPDLLDAELLSVSGTCHMVEVPLNVRYNFSSDDKQHFTASFGVSSYFMTGEYYHYSAVTSAGTAQGSLSHHHLRSDLFTVVDLSAGYQRRISNTVLFEASPYLKLPVKGIGTGNLYMSSAGIYIGVAKYFGKP